LVLPPVQKALSPTPVKTTQLTSRLRSRAHRQDHALTMSVV